MHARYGLCKGHAYVLLVLERDWVDGVRTLQGENRCCGTSERKRGEKGYFADAIFAVYGCC